MRTPAVVTDILGLIRIRDWTKNLFVLAVPFLSGGLRDVKRSIADLALVFLLFCLAASSVYILNDVLDRKKDRMGPDRRTRPLAGGRMAPAPSLGLSFLLAAVCLCLSWAFAKPAFPFLVLYLVINIFYSFAGRDIAVLDVLCVSAGFMLRIAAGATVAGTDTPASLFLASFFLVSGLAVSKRICEISFFGRKAGAFRQWLRPSLRPGLLVSTAAAYLLGLLAYSFFLVKYIGPSSKSWIFLTIGLAGIALWRAFEAVRTNYRSQSLWTVLFSDRLSMIGALVWTAAYAGFRYL